MGINTAYADHQTTLMQHFVSDICDMYMLQENVYG